MSVGKSILYGVVSGLIAAAAFGAIMLQMMPDILPKIAQLYGLSTTNAGFIVHVIHGGLIGGVFGIIAGTADSTMATSFYGVLYGLIWWVIGPVLVMPVWLGQSPRLSTEGLQAALPSLPGHLVFGFILGLLFALMTGSGRGQNQEPWSQTNKNSNKQQDSEGKAPGQI